jgi:hypothetical protein
MNMISIVLLADSIHIWMPCCASCDLMIDARSVGDVGRRKEPNIRIRRLRYPESGVSHGVPIDWGNKCDSYAE